MINKEELAFHLFACCIPVQGAKRAVMYDLNRNSWLHIPNDLAKILIHFDGMPKTEVYAQYDRGNHTILDTYFHFLEEHEFIFYAPQGHRVLFPPISTEWDYPAKISNAILDIASPDAYSISIALAELEALGCGFLQLRQIDDRVIIEWDAILKTIATAAFYSIDIYMPYSIYNLETIERWATEHKRIQNVFLYEAPKQSIENFAARVYGNMIFVTQPLLSDFFVQDPAYFTVTTPLYTESLHFNNYLNRKIYIDSMGNIKNAPEHDVVFGNINKEALDNIVNMQSFKSLWKIHKDMLLVCKDCEYRYMCVDSRIPIKEAKSGMWHFSTPCAYNPYMTKWKHESGYLPANPFSTFER